MKQAALSVAEPDLRETMVRLLDGNTDGIPEQLRLPTVSVIITAYNGEPFIIETLESVRQQSLCFLECIIVEDCSTDLTLAVIENYLKELDDPRFVLLRHESNAGQLAAQATGFYACHGDFVVFLDADDLLFHDCLENQLSAHLNSVPVVPVTCMDAAMIDDRGTILSGHHREMKPQTWAFAYPRMQETSVSVCGRTVTARLIPPAAANRLVIIDQYYWTTQSFMMFRADVLRLIMPERTLSFRICADYYLLGMIHAFNSTLLIENLGGAYRLHGSNGFTNRLLISSEMESGSSQSTRKQHTEMQELAAQTISQRYELFAVHWNAFRVTRALLSLGRSHYSKPYRNLFRVEGFVNSTWIYAIALVSSVFARVRKSFRTVERVILRGK